MEVPSEVSLLRRHPPLHPFLMNLREIHYTSFRLLLLYGCLRSGNWTTRKHIERRKPNNRMFVQRPVNTTTTTSSFSWFLRIHPEEAIDNDVRAGCSSLPSHLLTFNIKCPLVISWSIIKSIQSSTLHSFANSVPSFYLRHILGTAKGHESSLVTSGSTDVLGCWVMPAESSMTVLCSGPTKTDWVL